MNWYWLSVEGMTVAVETDHDGVIVTSPRIVAKFIGQPLKNLERWMSKMPGYRFVCLTPEGARPAS